MQHGPIHVQVKKETRCPLMYLIIVSLFHHSGCEPLYLFFSQSRKTASVLCIFCCSLCLCGTIVRSQEAGWDASERGGMCYHSNKLSHWQDCTTTVAHTGCRPRIQPLSCEGCVAFLVAGLKHPSGWDKEVQPPWIWVGGGEEREGRDDGHGGFILL